MSLSRLSDDEWLAVLKRSVDNRLVDGMLFPGFPSPDLQTTIVGSSGCETLGEAFSFYRHVKVSCAAYSACLNHGSEILDFGIGWGRIIRFFLKDVDINGLYGVDTDPALIEVCRQTAVPADVTLINARGLLPYPDDKFDLVFAYSVFTHLPEDVHLHWLKEIGRTLKPGGLLVATVEPPRFLRYFLTIQEENVRNSWEAFLCRVIKDQPNLFTDLHSKGFAFIRYATHEDYGDCVIAPSFVHRYWTNYFQVIEYLDDPSRFFQAVVVAKKGIGVVLPDDKTRIARDKAR